mgnify:FL=1
MRHTTVQGYLDSDKQGVTNYTVDGHCSCCGECCKDILPIDFVELNKIKKFVKSNRIKQQDHHLLPNTVDMTCPFLNIDGETRKCVIYPVRPKICQQFLCSKHQEELTELSKSREKAGRLMSLRKEIYGDEDNLMLAALAIANARSSEK